MKIAKAIVGGLGTILVALAAAFTDDVFDASEAANLAGVVVTVGLAVYAIWRVPNKPEEPPEETQPLDFSDLH